MRASSLPTFFDCPSSALACEHPYDRPSEPAAIGSAVHAALEDHVLGHEPDVRAICHGRGVDPTDVYPLLAMGRMGWDEVSEFFPNPSVEHPLQTDGLTGTTDVFSLSDGHMAVLDWKTNRERKDYHPQLMGYATCAADTYGMPESGHITVCTVWLRLGEIDVVKIRQGDIERFVHELQRCTLNIGKVYGPGPTCRWCRRQMVCDAKRKYLQHMIELFGIRANDVRAPLGLPSTLPESYLAALLPRVKLLEAACANYRDALKLILADGGLPDGLGNMIELVEQPREKIKPMEAWPILTSEGLSDEELASCMSITSGALMNIIGDKAAPGQKGKRKAEVKQKLREAGAMKQTITEIMKTTKGGQK